MGNMHLNAHYYQQFDADYSLDVPAEAFGGWRSEGVELDPDRTALVVMHAWDCGTPEKYPGWWRAVEYLPRAEAICRTVFPPLLAAVRESPMKLFHVVGRGGYYEDLPGYRRAVELAKAEPAPSPPPQRIEPDDTLQALRKFRGENVFVGAHNRDDVQRGRVETDFAPQARPVGDEPVAANGRQLLAVCRDAGVNHLIYVGFAINWCLLLSPGGMAEMSGCGVLCSTIRQAVTAVENRQTAREQLCKQIALWRVALSYGFVFDLDNFLTGLAAVEG